MTDSQPNRVSLCKETWREVKSCLTAYAPLIAAYGLVLGVFYLLMHQMPNAEIAQQFKSNPQLFKQHPELARQYLHESMGQLVWFLPIFPTMAAGHYVFTVKFLRHAMSKNQPGYSLGGFFHWLGQIVWKYLRPVLWLLIPIVGFFFYYRSMLRYALVSPLAILRREPELKTSWDLTKNNCWRIFGNYFLLMLLIVVACLIVAVILGALTGAGLAALHAPYARENQQVIFAVCIFQGLLAGFLGMVFSIYPCVTYRVLSREQRVAFNPFDNP